MKRFLNWLFRMTVEVGASRYDTFGSYPDGSAPLVTKDRAHYVSEDDEYVYQLLAHSASPSERARAEAWLTERARQS